MRDREFSSRSSQSNTYKIGYLSFPSLALGINRIEQGLVNTVTVNVTEWDIGSWCQQPDFIVDQHYKVTMNVHYHVCPDMTLDVARM